LPRASATLPLLVRNDGNERERGPTERRRGERENMNETQKDMLKVLGAYVAFMVLIAYMHIWSVAK
jgi:hypothetical protein